MCISPTQNELEQKNNSNNDDSDDDNSTAIAILITRAATTSITAYLFSNHGVARLESIDPAMPQQCRWAGVLVLEFRTPKMCARDV